MLCVSVASLKQQTAAEAACSVEERKEAQAGKLHFAHEHAACACKHFFQAWSMCKDLRLMHSTATDATVVCLSVRGIIEPSSPTEGVDGTCTATVQLLLEQI